MRLPAPLPYLYKAIEIAAETGEIPILKPPAPGFLNADSMVPRSDRRVPYLDGLELATRLEQAAGYMGSEMGTSRTPGRHGMKIIAMMRHSAEIQP